MKVDNIYVIAAICGNWRQESTLNPGIWEGLKEGAPGYGLGQWTDNTSGTVNRRTKLFEWLKKNGYSQNSGDGQLAYFIEEDYWLKNGAGFKSNFDTLSDFLSSDSTDLEYLTYEFFHAWEGIDDGTGPLRLSYAEDILTYLKNNMDKPRNPWYSSNSYNNVDKIHSNALRVYDFFTENKNELSDEELIALFSQSLKLRKKGGVIVVLL